MKFHDMTTTHSEHNINIEKPYLLFLGDAQDQLAVKTAKGVAQWRPEWCVGQLRLENCKADVGLPDLSLTEAKSKGARTMVLGVVNSGGFMPESWTKNIVQAMKSGMNVASGLHVKLESFEPIRNAADHFGCKLHNLRHTDIKFRTGTGEKRTGKRLLTIGTDCSIGKKYTALAIEKEMIKRGIEADFRATGQTGVLIAERGIAIDAVVSDFVAGAAEWLSPMNKKDHWDIVEGQGSLFHASYAGVSLGLLHGTQPDVLVLCHEPTRSHMRNLPHIPMPKIKTCIKLNEAHAQLVNSSCKVAAVSIDTSRLTVKIAANYLEELESQIGLPCVDPIRFGVSRIVDILEKVP